MSTDPDAACRFCSKAQKNVRWLIASVDTGARICDECIVWSVRAIFERRKEEDRQKPEDRPGSVPDFLISGSFGKMANGVVHDEERAELFKQLLKRADAVVRAAGEGYHSDAEFQLERLVGAVHAMRKNDV